MTALGSDTAQVLADHVAQTKFGDLPADAVETAKRGILDTIGVCVGGIGTAPGLQELVAVLDDGGRPDSTILGTGVRVPAPTAAFVNGAAAHVLDYDDTHETMGGHITAPILTSALALAERLGDVDGRAFLTAVVLAQDVYTRLSVLSLTRFGLHTPLVLGGFAAAAACGKLLGLDADALYRAFGIAACRAGGVGQLTINEGSDLRGYYNGFVARDGLLAALMAERGIGGIAGVFDGRFGLFEVVARGDVDRESMLAGLGSSYPCTGISYKPWPACRYAHVYIQATLDIVLEHDLAPDDIRRVIAHVGDLARQLCEPRGRYRPATAMDAKFSLPYVVAVAASRRSLKVGDFTESALRDARIHELADRVEFAYEPSLDPVPPRAIPPGVLEIEVRDRARHVRRVDLAYGCPDHPMSWDALVEKFEDCVSSAPEPIAPARTRAAIEAVRALDTSPRIDRLVLSA
jgi:2-methylcitrate dehydratase PrpD